MIKRLRKKIMESLMKANILCDPLQIISNLKSSGYFIPDNFDICDNRTPKQEKIEPPITKPLFEFKDITNPQELWILEQLCKGVKLQRQDVEERFKQSQTTASRLLAKLRREGIIKFVGNGNQGYWQMLDSQIKLKCPIFIDSD